VFSPPGARPEGLTFGQPLGPESPSFAGLGASPAAPRLFCRLHRTRSRAVTGGEPSFRGPALARYFTQRAAEPHSLCDWHFLVALILRVRRLSACSLVPTPFVDTDHPRVSSITCGASDGSNRVGPKRLRRNIAHSHSYSLFLLSSTFLQNRTRLCAIDIRCKRLVICWRTRVIRGSGRNLDRLRNFGGSWRAERRKVSRFPGGAYQAASGKVLIPAFLPRRLYIVTSVYGSSAIPS